MLTIKYGFYNRAKTRITFKSTSLVGMAYFFNLVFVRIPAIITHVTNHLTIVTAIIYGENIQPLNVGQTDRRFNYSLKILNFAYNFYIGS